MQKAASYIRSNTVHSLHFFDVLLLPLFFLSDSHHSYSKVIKKIMSCPKFSFPTIPHLSAKYSHFTPNDAFTSFSIRNWKCSPHFIQLGNDIQHSRNNKNHPCAESNVSRTVRRRPNCIIGGGKSSIGHTEDCLRARKAPWETQNTYVIVCTTFFHKSELTWRAICMTKVMHVQILHWTNFFFLIDIAAAHEKKKKVCAQCTHVIKRTSLDHVNIFTPEWRTSPTGCSIHGRMRAGFFPMWSED